MKKILALVLAALMIAAMAVSMVSASDDEYPELDVRDMRAYGQDNTYLGDTPIAIAPTIDGQVDANEYQQEFVISKDGDAKWEYVNNTLEADIHEYYAYDADNFYVAVVVPQDSPNCFFQFNVNSIDSPSSACFTARAQLLFYPADVYTSTWGTNFTTGEDGEELFKTTAGHGVTSRGVAINLGANATWREGELIPGGTRILLSTLAPAGCEVQSKHDATNKLTTYEIKVSKAALATTWRTGGEDAAADVDFIGIHYHFDQKYEEGKIYSEQNATYTKRTWNPLTDAETGENASWVLDDAGLAGGTLVHFVFAYAEPALEVIDTTAAPETTEAPSTTAAPATTKAPETTKAPVADTKAPETTEAAKKGCKGSLTVSALALLPIIAGGVVIARKRED